MNRKKLLAVAAVSLTLISSTAVAEITFRNTITGEPLDMSVAKSGGNETVFKQFKETGKNPYNGDKEAIQKGHDLYLPACSGCHGHEAEGKLGPGLADDYWTYPSATKDQGLFEILFGGAKGMMGPQYVNLSTDEMLMIMSWIRDIYTGDPKKAKWLKK
ncbi:cytochrome c(L), periplasmic [Methylobacter svalbardensis]|uniref:cytochrome c(L), periplasmic n=1 Tax=Methylobacter svalbardensis TaxID=3080016 RepID=UPI0030ECF815